MTMKLKNPISPVLEVGFLSSWRGKDLTRPHFLRVLGAVAVKILFGIGTGHYVALTSDFRVLDWQYSLPVGMYVCDMKQ